MVSQLFQVFARIIEFNLKLQEKKEKWKGKYKHERQNLSQNNAQLTQNQSSQNAQNAIIKENAQEIESKMKQLFQQRILELEQFYQNQIQQAKIPMVIEQGRAPSRSEWQLMDLRVKKLKSIVTLLNQFLEELLVQNGEIQELNNQLTSLQLESTQSFAFQFLARVQRKVKKVVWVIVAVKRLQRLGKNQVRLPIFYRPLKIDTPIFGVVNSIIESFVGQQNLVGQLKNTLWEREQNIGSLMQENNEFRLQLQILQKEDHEPGQDIDHEEIKALFQQELSKEIEIIQAQVEQYKAILQENQAKSEISLEQRKKEIEELSVKLGQMNQILMSTKQQNAQLIEERQILINQNKQQKEEIERLRAMNEPETRELRTLLQKMGGQNQSLQFDINSGNASEERRRSQNTNDKNFEILFFQQEQKVKQLQAELRVFAELIESFAEQRI